MNSFTLHLQSGKQYKKIDNVVSFIGVDASGAFGVMPSHERMMTVLGFGLARFHVLDGPWCYIALPGGVLYFVENDLFISTHQFVYGDNYDVIAKAVSGVLALEEEALHDFKARIEKMEFEMTRRLWKLQEKEI